MSDHCCVYNYNIIYMHMNIIAWLKTYCTLYMGGGEEIIAILTALTCIMHVHVHGGIGCRHFFWLLTLNYLALFCYAVASQERCMGTVRTMRGGQTVWTTSSPSCWPTWRTTALPQPRRTRSQLYPPSWPPRSISSHVSSSSCAVSLFY